MKPDEFEKSLQKGDIGPLYYFHGDEPYLIEKGVKSLLARTVSPDSRDFNLDIFYGKECKGDEIAAASQTLPMFADRRVVLVKRSSDLSAAALEILTEYITDPSPSTCLIFEGEKIDQRKRFFVEMKKQGNLVEFKRLYENQLGPFIREEVAGYGKKMEAAASEMLVYLAGNNLQEIAAEVEKVATYVGTRDTIKIADVKELVSDTKVDTVFELADALGGKELGKALRNLNTLLRDGEAPLMVLAMLTRHFRQLWRVKELCAKRVPPQEIGKAAGINPYFIKGIVEQAKNYRLSEFKGIFERFFETDLALKTSGGKPVNLMECLVMDICGKGADRRAS
ncbi:MAG TPA: DNA polymerase III subunit delta [Geobacteraceae bacterium]|nr:DNA polymerase III subunit delta [Geobacteraceae bacterium]